MNEDNNKPGGSSLTRRILIGLLLGIFTGFFLGEYASTLAVVGKAYVGLLQMSILPYMVVSLIGGIGQLSYGKARNLAATGGVVLVGSWLLAFVVVFLLPLAFPSIEAGSFYSPSLVQVADVDFIDLYVPVNPFSSLARTVIPAVAVFSVVAGIALIGVKNKQPLLDLLNAVSETMSRIAMMVVQLTPIGVFAIAANAAGTMTIDEFGRLQTYILTFIMATLVLTFWILPGLVTVLTPFTYRAVMRASRSALLTGFVTGNLFIVLPLLVESGKRLFEDYRLQSGDTDSYVEVLIPTSFNFPNIGKLLILLFVLFAGWFTGRELPIAEYPMFSGLGLFTLFGGVDLALPFLLDQMRIPSDLYQLYVVTGVVNGWFATLLAVMNLFAFTLIATAAAMGKIQFNGRRLIRFCGVSISILAATILGTRLTLSAMASEEDMQRATLLQTEIGEPAEATVYQEEVPPRYRANPKRPRLEQILERGILRVGYNPGSLPFAYFNENGNLVGYDVELFHTLARELGVKLEFVPWRYESALRQLDAGEFDVLAGGMIVDTERMTTLAFSEPYMEVTWSLVVEDHRRNDFPTWSSVDKGDLRIGITGRDRAETVNLAMSQSEVVEIASNVAFFQGGRTDLDALAISAEAGSAWTVVYPRYAVAIPKPLKKRPVAIATARGDREFTGFFSDWLRLKKTDGTLDRLYDTWILGKGAEKKVTRWSIIKDVLHWVD